MYSTCIVLDIVEILERIKFKAYYIYIYIKISVASKVLEIQQLRT